MSRLVFRHSDFTLELHAPGLADTLAAARSNGLADGALRCDWRWSGDGAVERVERAGENGGGAETVWEPGGGGMPEAPFFFDNAEQDVWIELREGRTKGRVELRRASDAARFQSRGRILYGPLAFGNDVGRADLGVSWERDGIRRRFVLSFDVLSSKLDVRTDWRRIVEDVEAEYRMLSYDFLRRTYHQFAENPEGDHSDRIWWEVFARLRDRFFAACDVILARPRTRGRTAEELRRADRLRRTTPALEEEWFEHRRDAGRLYRVAIEETTRDTPENRFFKHAVLSVARRHGRLASRIAGAAAARGATPGFLEQIERASARLAALEANPFFHGVGRFDGLKQVSLVLQQAPGYAEVARTWAVLERLYALGEGLFALETKDIAELYEIWCFVEVKNRCKAVLGIDEGSVRNVARGELGELFGADAAKGRRSRIVLEKKDAAGGDVRLELFYNPQTGGDPEKSGIADTEAPTGGEQRPDIVLQLVREHGGGAFRLTHLFDAKYRIDGRTADGTADKPPEDAINQMHRYRDAIYYAEAGGAADGAPGASPALKREVIGGYVLFPGSGRPEDVARAYYTRSIGRVGIGALPLRPGNESNAAALEDFIRRLLARGTVEQLLGTIPHKGTETELEGAVSAGRILASGGKTPEGDARWMWRHRAFFLETRDFDRRRLGAAPEEIRIVSIAWMPPVTLIATPGRVRTDVDAAALRAEFADFPRVTGRYHVWFGDLANAESWAKKFAGE